MELMADGHGGWSTCGITSGRRGRERESWWRCREVQGAIKEKRRQYKIWQRSSSEEDREGYIESRREAKRQEARAKAIAWQEWSENLNTE